MMTSIAKEKFMELFSELYDTLDHTKLSPLTTEHTFTRSDGSLVYDASFWNSLLPTEQEQFAEIRDNYNRTLDENT